MAREQAAGELAQSVAPAAPSSRGAGRWRRDRPQALSAPRLAVGRARIVVVKVGSSSLTTSAGGLDPARLDALVDAVAARVAAGSQVVLVSSGAIAAGLAPLGLPRRPRDLATQQAAASVGQQLLAERYAASFARHRLTVGQVLLTSDDVVRRAHYRNAQRTFGKLLSFGVVPVVNENDTVATAEIRFGDNDRLAALVAHLVGAGALILLSDVDALYTGDPRLAGIGSRSREVPDAGALTGVGIAASGSDVGTGGMESKLTSALTATGAGIPVLLASAADAVAALRCLAVDDDLAGPTVGTAFAPATRRTSARLFWLRHAATSSGSISLDDGAVAAVVDRRKSLLPAGITAFYGDFESGDVVDLLAPDGEIVARGFVGHDAARDAGDHRPLAAPSCRPSCGIRWCTPTIWSRCRRPRRGRSPGPRSRVDTASCSAAEVPSMSVLSRQHLSRPGPARRADRCRATRDEVLAAAPPRAAAAAELALLTRAVKDARAAGDGRRAARSAGRRSWPPTQQRCRGARSRPATAGLAGGPAAADRVPGRRRWPAACANWPGCPTRWAPWCAARCCPTACS